MLKKWRSVEENIPREMTWVLLYSLSHYINKEYICLNTFSNSGQELDRIIPYFVTSINRKFGFAS